MKQVDQLKVHKCACQICQEHPYSSVACQHKAINRVLTGLDEKNRRRFIGLLALQWGRGSVQRLRIITGLSRTTILRGRIEVQRADRSSSQRVRLAGGGRKIIEKNSPAS